MEWHFHNAAGAISWLFQLVALPFYSGRMTADRMMADLSIHAQAQLVRAEVKKVEAFYDAGREMEQQLAQALVDLQTGVARRAAVEVYELAFERLKQTYVQGDDS